MLTKRKKQKGKPKIASRKAKVGDVTFDSQTEARYYKKLLADPEVKYIELQPIYQIIEPFEVECKRCKVYGMLKNHKTGRYNQCTLCKGVGKRTKQGAIYTADFKVTYQDGYQEVIDVKGYANDSFALRQKLFESVTGLELIVVSQDGRTGEWVRK